MILETKLSELNFFNLFNKLTKSLIISLEKGQLIHLFFIIHYSDVVLSSFFCYLIIFGHIQSPSSGSFLSRGTSVERIVDKVSEQHLNKK